MVSKTKRRKHPGSKSIWTAPAAIDRTRSPKSARAGPLVSIVIPSYNSQATLRRSLETMTAQSYQPLEIIVVDSSPTDACAQLVRTYFPQVIFYASPSRLYPHAARNAGIELARGELIVSTDPDIYAPVDWVARLVAAYFTHYGVIVGSYQCYGTYPVDRAVHFSKFDKWLPGGAPRAIDIAPTANVLYPRALLQAIGGFDGTGMVGDTLMSWEYTRLGIPLIFMPDAVVEHHHLSSVAALLRERRVRGREFAQVRRTYFAWSARHTLFVLLLTLLPLRLLKLTARTLRHGWRSRQVAAAWRALPVILLAHGAWLAGEAEGYWRALRAGRR
ncbi:MAG: glycosyltransferase family A protein [Caldilineaceae bacterium]